MDIQPKQNPRLRWISKKYLFGYFFLAVSVFLIYQFLLVALPFLNTILVSLTLAMVFFPLNRKIRARLPGRVNLSAGFAVASVILVLIVPLLITGWMMFKESKVMLHAGEELLKSMPASVEGFQPEQDSFFGKVLSFGGKFNIDVQELVLGGINSLGENISKSSVRILKNVLGLGMDFIVLFLTLFLFFRDGEKIVAKVIELAPMDQRHKQMIAERLYITIVAVVRGVLLTAAVQGSCAAVGYAIGGVSVPITLGILTAAATLIPPVGSALVWLPTGLYVFFAHSHTWGIFIILWGLLVVSWIDNVLRPLFISEQAKLPIIVLFLALIGGLRAYGVSGLLLGPLLVSCIFAFIQIYQEEFSGKTDDAV